MEQLSGGEKTVAALALLFAIDRSPPLLDPTGRTAPSYQPSPSFVLDGVDAALDNRNVGQSGKLYPHAFQFIVVSLEGSLYERGRHLSRSGSQQFSDAHFGRRCPYPFLPFLHSFS